MANVQFTLARLLHNAKALLQPKAATLLTPPHCHPHPHFYCPPPPLTIHTHTLMHTQSQVPPPHVDPRRSILLRLQMTYNLYSFRHVQASHVCEGSRNPEAVETLAVCTPIFCSLWATVRGAASICPRLQRNFWYACTNACVCFAIECV